MCRRLSRTDDMALRIRSSSLSATSSIFVSYSKSLSIVSMNKSPFMDARADTKAVAEAIQRQAGHALTVIINDPDPYLLSSEAV